MSMMDSSSSPIIETEPTENAMNVLAQEVFRHEDKAQKQHDFDLQHRDAHITGSIRIPAQTSWTTCSTANTAERSGTRTDST